MDGRDPWGTPLPGSTGTPPTPWDPARAAASARDVVQLRDALRLTPDLGATRALDRLAELACRLLGASGARVSLVGESPVVVGSSVPHPTGVPLPADPLALATAASGEPLVCDDTAADLRLRDLPAVTSGAVGAYLGVPLTLSGGEVVGVLCVCSPHPRQWTGADLATVGELADSALTELQLSALALHRETDRVRWGLAAEAAQIGTYDWDLVSGRLSWDQRASQLLGVAHSAADHRVEDLVERVHLDDRARVRDALAVAVAAVADLDVQYRVVRADTGETRWLRARGRALAGREGRAARLVGAAYDATEERDAEARLARVLETMPACFVQLDREWRFRYVNAEAEKLMDRARDELVGTVMWDAFPITVGTELEAAYRRAVATDRPVDVAVRFPTRDADYEVRAWPGPDGLSVYWLDVTDRRRAEQVAERARVRMALLASVDAELSAARDGDAALARLPRLVVPTLATACIVTVVDREGRARDIGSWHADPERQALIARYAEVRQDALPPDSPVARALRLGSAVTESAANVRALMPPGEARDVLDRLGVASAAALPLTVDERAVGVLTLYLGPGRSFGAEDLAVARQVAARAGRVVERVRWQSRQVQVAETLQRSLLSAPPQVSWADLAVRYVPATEAARVGGDWYDAFLQRRGADPGARARVGTGEPAGDTVGDMAGDMVVVIGDVVGHDIEAAATMGQLRGLLRGIAHHSGAGPAEVLRGLDDAIVGMHAGTLATAAVARLECAGDSAGLRLRWANAGHPPPLLVTADGAVQTLGTDVGDLMLGVDPRAERAERWLDLRGPATLLLYTDGLVERRGRTLDEGTALLRETLGALAGRPLDEFCDELLDRALPATPQDDVALVAVRLPAGT